MSFTWIEKLEAEKKTETDYRKSGSRWEVVVKPEQVEAAARAAWDAGYFIEDISVVDLQEGFLVVYHFDHWQFPGRVTFKVLVPHEQPEVPTISHIHSGANWHERESFDFFGVVFTGHPDLKPLLLPDDLGFHPLLKKPEERASLDAIANVPEKPQEKPQEASGQAP